MVLKIDVCQATYCDLGAGNDAMVLDAPATLNARCEAHAHQRPPQPTFPSAFVTRTTHSSKHPHPTSPMDSPGDEQLQAAPTA